MADQYKVVNPNLGWNAPTSYKDDYWANLEQQQERELGLIPGYLGSIRSHGERSNLDQSPSSTGAFSPWQITEKTRQLAIKKWDIDPKLSPENAAKVAGLLARDDQKAAKGDPYVMAKMHHGGRDEKNWGSITQAYANRVMAGLKKMSPIGDANASETPYMSAQDKNSQEAQARINAVNEKYGFDVAKAKSAYLKGKLTPDEEEHLKQIADTGDIQLPGYQPRILIPDNVAELYNSGNMPREDMIEFEKEIKEGRLIKPASMKLQETQPLSTAGKIVDAFTGSDRQTTDTQTLPSWRTAPELSKFDGRMVQQLLGENPETIIKTLQVNNPNIQIDQDSKGNLKFKSAEDGQWYSVKPGMDFIDFAGGVGQVAAFGANPITGVVKGAAGDIAIQGAIEAGKAVSGGEFSVGNVAGAGLIGGAARTVGKVANVVKNNAGTGIGGASMETLNPSVQSVEDISKAAKAGDMEALAVASKPDLATITASNELGIANQLPADIAATDRAFIDSSQAVKSQIGSVAKQQQDAYINEFKDKRADVIGAGEDVGQLQHDLLTSQNARATAANTAKSEAASKVDSVVNESDLVVARRTQNYLKTKEANNALTSEEKRVMELVTPQHSTNTTGANLQGISDKVKSGLSKKMEESYSVSNPIYEKIEATIPGSTPVNTADFKAYFAERLKDRQGDIANLTPLERSVMSKLKGKDTSSKLIDSKGNHLTPPSSESTFAIVSDVRKTLTEARVNKMSEFASTDKKILQDLERLVDKAERKVIRENSLEDQLLIARKEVANRKLLEKNYLKLFGNKAGEGSLASKLKTAIKSMANNGETDSFNKIVKMAGAEHKDDLFKEALQTLSYKELKKLGASAPTYRSVVEQHIKTIEPNLARLNQALASTKDEKLKALLMRDKQAFMHQKGVGSDYKASIADISSVTEKDVSNIGNKVVSIKNQLLKGSTEEYKELMSGLSSVEKQQVTAQVLSKIVETKSLKQSYENLDKLLNSNKLMSTIAHNLPAGTIKNLKRINTLSKQIHNATSTPGTQTGKLLSSLDALNQFDATLSYLTKSVVGQWFPVKLLSMLHTSTKTTAKLESILTSSELSNAVAMTAANGGSLTRRVSRIKSVKSLARELYGVDSSNKIMDGINALIQANKG